MDALRHARTALDVVRTRHSPDDQDSGASTDLVDQNVVHDLNAVEKTHEFMETAFKHLMDLEGANIPMRHRLTDLLVVSPSRRGGLVVGGQERGTWG